MERPSWAPVIFSGALPREVSDLLAITILLLTSVQTTTSSLYLFAGMGSAWILLVLVPVTCTLASLSNSPRREHEELAIFAYGGTPRQIEIRYVLRGTLIAAIGLLPLFIHFLQVGLAYSFDLIILSILAFLGGLSYAVPAVRRTRSSDFVGHYKG